MREVGRFWSHRGGGGGGKGKGKGKGKGRVSFATMTDLCVRRSLC